MDSLVNKPSKQTTPWKYWPLFLVSTFLGLGAGYLVSWQNLKRMGKEQEAKQFLMVGGIVFLIAAIVIYLLPGDSVKLLGNLAAIGFPAWVYYKHQKPWEAAHPNQARFSWSLIGWGLLGIILIVVLYLIIGIFAPAPK